MNGTAARAGVAAKPTPVLTVTADRTKADLDQPIKLTGSLTGDGAGLAGQTVTITPNTSSCDVPASPFSVQTGPDGSFETTAKPPCGAYFAASVPATDQYEAAAAQTGYVTVRQATDITESASIDKYGKVSVSATLEGRNAPVDYRGRTVQVQYSFDGVNDWSTVKKVKLTENWFNTSIQYNESGYWRTVFAGSDSGMPGVSPARKAWRWNTHFIHFKLSPRKLRFKHRTTVSGTLMRYYALGKKRGYGKQKVYIYFNCKSDRKEVWYTDSGWVRTNAKGHFKKRVRAYCTGQFIAVFDGGKDTFAAGSKLVSVKVSGTPSRSVAQANPAFAGPVGGFTPAPSLLGLLGAEGRKAAAIG